MPDPDDAWPARLKAWIASLSFGARRRFSIAPRRGSPDHRRTLELGAGDLLVMRGTTQEGWRHAVPKTRWPVDPRLNPTFRHVVSLA